MVNKLIVANWKMNGSAAGLADYVRALADLPLVICPPAPLLPLAAGLMKDTALKLGAQDCHAEPAGAFTGDVSASLIHELGAQYVIVGHSERRRGHGESDAFIWRKAGLASAVGMVPILCVGEREGEDTAAVVAAQLQGLSAFEGKELVVAYEPLWAISAAGTGRMPTPAEVKEIHLTIKVILEKTLPNIRTSVIYGGSVKAENALFILGEKAVDGVLVGAASLDSAQMVGIYQASIEAQVGQ